MASSSTTPCPTPGPIRRAVFSSEIQELFLHAVDFGDAMVVKRILEGNPTLNVDFSDALGRTPLRLAVKNENRELVEILLNLSSSGNIHEALLQAIDAGLTTIAETTLKHPRYMDITHRQRRLGDIDAFFTPELGAQFPSYVTPLNLAAQKEQYVIVSLLLQRGETIVKPHKFVCACQECLNKGKFDQLRMAKCRLDAYRGLASEAYISLCSQDPIQTAMELANELQTLSKTEICFKAEYSHLVKRLSDYLVKLLDRVWTQRELSVVLDKTGSPETDRYESLARLRMAMECEQKLFVAHPNCQQRIVQCWHRGTSKMEDATWSKRLAIFLLSLLCYPFAAIVFLVHPDSKCGRFMKLPTVKFMSHTISFLTFLTLIIISSTETISIISNKYTLASSLPHLHRRYLVFRNRTGLQLCGENFPLRTYHPTVTEIMISIWVIGLIAQECQEIWDWGYKVFSSSGYNYMDFLLLSVYTATYTLRYWVMLQWHNSVHTLETVQDWTLDPKQTEKYVYWLNADRLYWTMTDPLNMAEGLFAMANILSVSRVTYLLPANETLGPMQISLGRMINDVLKFFALAIFVIATFMVGLRNLFWYYTNRQNIELNSSRVATPEVVSWYGSDMDTFRTVFWSIYGRGAIKAVSLGGYNNTVTETIGQTLDATYHVIMIILLINMFIAMMSRSFDEIAEDSDVEWKYARSALYLDYIKDGRVLPVPLNLLEIPHCLVVYGLRKLAGWRTPEPEWVQGSLPDVRRVALVNKRSNHLRPEHPFERRDDGRRDSNGPRTSPRRLKTKRKSAPPTIYQEVIQSIIQRYIYDVQRQNETCGNTEEMRNCLSHMEREVLNQLEVKRQDVREARKALRTVAKEIHDITGENSESFINMIYMEGESSSSSYSSHQSCQSLDKEEEEEEEEEEDGEIREMEQIGTEAEEEEEQEEEKAEEDEGYEVVQVHREARPYSSILEDISLEEDEEAVSVFEESEAKDEVSLFDDILGFIDDSDVDSKSSTGGQGH